jgi:G3E family GTPase
MSTFEDENGEMRPSDESEEVPESEKTPVTIVTGFLGAGKTTLVNYILKEQSTWKICVVENEFGEVAIDDGLVVQNLAAKEDLIIMDNGCVCCSVRGDLVRTFGMLVSRRKNFDAIIIETTGLADPAPILFTFNTNALLQDNYRIDSIVCLVDTKHVELHLDEVKPDGDVNEAEHQIAFSDRIILNKLDLVTPEELSDIKDRIRSLNNFAHIIQTERSRVPLDQILGLNSFSLETLTKMDPTLMDEDEAVDEGHVHDEHCTHDHDSTGHVHDEHCSHGHDEHDHCDSGHIHDEHCSHGHDEHDHNEHKAEVVENKRKKKKHNLSLVSSVGFTIHGLLDVAKFNEFMSAFLKANAKNLFRSKGILAFANQGDTKFVFQGVHEQINFGPSEHPWVENEERVSKLVFIGKNLDYDYIKEGIRVACEHPDHAVIKMHKRQE